MGGTDTAGIQRMNPGGSIADGFHTNKTYTSSDRNGSQRRCEGKPLIYWSTL